MHIPVLDLCKGIKHNDINEQQMICNKVSVMLATQVLKFRFFCVEPDLEQS